MYFDSGMSTREPTQCSFHFIPGCFLMLPVQDLTSKMRLAKRRNAASVWDILRPLENHRIQPYSTGDPSSNTSFGTVGLVMSAVQVQLIQREVHPPVGRWKRLEAYVVHNKTSGSFVSIGFHWLILHWLIHSDDSPVPMASYGLCMLGLALCQRCGYSIIIPTGQKRDI